MAVSVAAHCSCCMARGELAHCAAVELMLVHLSLTLRKGSTNTAGFSSSWCFSTRGYRYYRCCYRYGAYCYHEYYSWGQMDSLAVGS